MALEAAYGWEWLADLLEETGYDVHLAHPLRTQTIAAARVKTDAVDAKTLAHLLRAGLLPVRDTSSGFTRSPSSYGSAARATLARARTARGTRSIRSSSFAAGISSPGCGSSQFQRGLDAARAGQPIPGRTDPRQRLLLPAVGI